MSTTKFIAILPQPTQSGDKIQIRGQISNNAKEFSINFANEVNEDPQSIAYHFKWDIANEMLIEDYMEDNEWINSKETPFDAFDGQEFALEFAFLDDGIYVYLAREDGRNLITHFQPVSDFQLIESVQVWGDVEKITLLSFSYK
ncbi:uncharacterized protein Lgals7_3 isoform X2 [Zeugodacus cucurbitae]|uniref:Galectin n=1 Tax=Zeugodacus cucurbitae TaxID=28588 RepID=A0A0A1XDN7_ZEUCU|nr:uncharacterized protein Lgals7_3 isoform X2 [Zeugodacus cucurbitae]